MGAKSDQNKSNSVFRVRVLFEDKVHLAYVGGEIFTIGSMANLPVVVHHPSVEKKHVVVSCVKNQIWLIDQGGAAGTMVNGKMLKSGVPYHYKPGDNIKLGKSDTILQIQIFSARQDDMLEAKLVLKEAKTRASGESQEVLRQAREQSSLIAAEATAQAKLRLEKAELDALAAAEEIMDAAKASGQILLEQAQKNADLERERLLVLAEKDADGIRSRAKDDGRVLLQDYQNKANHVIAQVKEQSEAHEKKVREQTLEYEERVRANALREGQEKVDAMTQEALELRKKAEFEATGILEAARSEASRQLSLVYQEADEIRARAKLDAQGLLAETKTETDHLAELARQKGAAVEQEMHEKCLKHFREAEKEAETRCGALLAEAERKALESAQEREKKAQERLHESLRTAEKTHAEAREQANALVSAATLEATQRRAELISSALTEAGKAADELKSKAREQAETLMEESRQRQLAAQAKAEKDLVAIFQAAHDKGDDLVQQRRMEADGLAEAARKTAGEIAERAQSEANDLLKRAQQMALEIPDKTRAQAEKETIKVREAAATWLQSQKEQNQKAMEQARAEASALITAAQAQAEQHRSKVINELETMREELIQQRAKTDQDLSFRRTELEAEIRQQRALEIERLDKHWKTLQKMEENKRLQEFNQVLSNLQLGLPSLVEGLSSLKASESEWAQTMKSVRSMIESALSVNADAQERPVSALEKIISFGSRKSA